MWIFKVVYSTRYALILNFPPGSNLQFIQYGVDNHSPFYTWSNFQYYCKKRKKINLWTYSEVVTTGCQDCLMRMEFLLFSNKGDITKYAITSLLVQGCQDSIVMGARLTKPLTCQHFLNAERKNGKDFINKCRKQVDSISNIEQLFLRLFDKSWKVVNHIMQKLFMVHPSQEKLSLTVL